jgi:hypothetical protein
MLMITHSNVLGWKDNLRRELKVKQFLKEFQDRVQQIIEECIVHLQSWKIEDF